MELYGSLEEKEQINLRIHPTELHGLGPLLELLLLQALFMRSHVTEYGGLLEDMEIINLRIHLTELHGLNPLLGMVYLRANVKRSHHAVYYRT
jgi:hypothetical protein